MSWQNMTIGKKITLGFGLVLLLLAVTGVLSYTGVGGIVGNATEVIDGNKLDGTLAQKEVDHLNWVNQVNALLTDDKVTKLDVQTDDHQCAFGQWLYGEGRREAEGLVSSLTPLFKEIEAPHLRLHESAKDIGKLFRQADHKLPGFLAAKEVDHLKWAAAVDELFLNNLNTLDVQIDDHQCGLGKWLYGDGAKSAVAMVPELAPLIEALKEPHRNLHESAEEIRSTYKRIHPGLVELLMARLDDHRRWSQNVAVGIIEKRGDLGVQTDAAQCAFGRFLASPEAMEYKNDFDAFGRFVESVKEPHDKLHETARQIEAALAKGDKERAETIFQTGTLPALEKIAGLFNEMITAEKDLVGAQQAAREIYRTKTLPALEKTQEAMEAMKAEAEKALDGMRKANAVYARETIPALADTQRLLNEIREEAKRHILTDVAMLDAAQGTKRNVTIVAIVAIILGIVFAFVIARGISAVLQGISAQMSSGAEQVASASAQVSSASQSLAEGASENAAALEETSSSLEEMASMTKANADNASQANSLMTETMSTVSKAGESMKEMTKSMDDISLSGQEIGKIIKTIDEIAFQTNLLALNAAVEAARAGEAGAGFAVVADEVRNLAQRAADAAKNTASLIEDTIQKIDDGNRLVRNTDEVFSAVSINAAKVGELVSEISAASHEQAQGIEQINTAMTQMDRVTQQNAANAEESASASEELNAQAESMHDTVAELVRLVVGKGSSSSLKTIRPSNGKRNATRPRIAYSGEKNETSQTVRPAMSKGRIAKPEDLIPMDDDFGDF